MSKQRQIEYMKLIQKHEKIIHKVIGLHVDVAEDRRDLYQEILLQTWRSFSNFKGNSAFSTWLYKVALNTVLTFIPALMIGVLFGEVLEGTSLIACFQNSRTLMKIIIIVLVFVPIMSWSGDKMNKKAFGEDLKTLEDNIIRMETLQ